MAVQNPARWRVLLRSTRSPKPSQMEGIAEIHEESKGTNNNDKLTIKYKTSDIPTTLKIQDLITRHDKFYIYMLEVYDLSYIKY